MALTLDTVYDLVGLFLLVFVVYTILDRQQKARWGTAAFWGLYGVTFLWGAQLPPAIVGAMVVIMAVIAGAGWMGIGAYNERARPARLEMAARFGDRLFVPALTIPLVTFLVAEFTKLGALVGFGIAAVVALVLVLLLTRERVGQTFNEGRRLIDAIGWAVILSQFLAALGYLFDQAGVGKVVSGLVSAILPSQSFFWAVVAYCVGMAVFTMIMGNAFAAFAVITTGVGIPLVMKMHGANPAIAAVIAMLAGYCGTLMTPMAANFNIVPAALLEMKDKYGVIKAQVATALPLLCINIGLMYFLAGGK